MFLITKSNWGGAGRYVFDLSTMLPTESFETKVVCGGNGTLVEKLQDNNVQVATIEDMSRDMKVTKDAQSLRKIFKILKHEQPDVLHLNSPKAAGLGALCGRILGIKKVIYTIHGFTFNEDRPLIQKLLIKIFTWITLILSHEIIILSKTEYNQVQNWPFLKNKITIIPLGIKPPHFLPKESARKALSQILNIDLPLDKLIVGTIAELHKNKGYSYSIEAMGYLPQFLYIIIGDGEDNPKLKQQIKDLNAQNIFLTGNIVGAAQYLKAFDIFLLPSVKEGLPYTLIEAGMAEVPIISTHVGGIPNLITHNKEGLLIKPKSSFDIKNTLLKISSGQLDTKNLEVGLINKLRTDFSFEKMLEMHVCLYKK